MTALAQRQGDSGQHWQRLAERRMWLSADAEVSRQETRGQLWYIVRDKLGDRYYRVDPSVYLFLALLDGTRTVDDAYAICLERLGEDAPTETEIIRLLWRLHAADLIKGDVAGRTEDAVAQAERGEARRFWAQLRSPLAIRIPLLDPDRLLDRMRPLSAFLFSPLGFAIWLIAIAIGTGYAAVNWQALGGNFSDQILSTSNLIVIGLIFPIIKALHEIGHGLALKRWGCETHETGIMFLVFMPVPYIDASASVSITEPWRRAIVGAAGLYVELFIAAIAMVAWAHMEPGLGRAIAFNTILIAGASAVLFNGNPLLKFDAYYVLSDLAEIPNLAQRASDWWLFQIQTRLLGAENAQDPVDVPSERNWFLFYAPAALVYRLFLMSVIVVFVAQQAFFLGIILAILALFNVIVLPLWKGAVFLVTSPRLKRNRVRVLAGTVAFVGALVVLVGLVPVPSRTIAQGVVWYENGAELRAGAAGSIIEAPARSGSTIDTDQTILTMSAPEIDAEIRALGARLDALQAQRRRELSTDRQRAQLTAEEITFIEERLATTRARRENLIVTSPASGVLILPDQDDRIDAWIARGESLGHVVGEGPMTIRVALPQSDMERVSGAYGAIEARLSGDLAYVYPVSLARATPQATDVLPAALLTTDGGGPFALRPPGPGETMRRALEAVFVLELALPVEAPARFGERAHVRFDHGHETLWTQGYRAMRQLLLAEFNV